jgi:hypothetical protein
MTSDFNDIVNIEWRTGPAIEEVDKLLAKVNQLDQAAEKAGLSAGRSFSAGFTQGMAGAFESIALLRANLDAVLRDLGNAITQGAARPARQSVSAFRNAQGRFISEEEYYRSRGVGGGGGGMFPPPNFSIEPDYGGGSRGSYDAVQSEMRQRLRQQQMANWQEAGGGQGLGNASRPPRGTGYNFFPTPYDPTGLNNQQYPLPGLGLPSFYESRQQYVQPGLTGFGDRLVPVSHDQSQLRALAEMAADMDEQIETAMVGESIRRRNLSLARNDYASWSQRQLAAQLPSVIPHGYGLTSPAEARQVGLQNLMDQFRPPASSLSGLEYDQQRRNLGRLEYDQWQRGQEALHRLGEGAGRAGEKFDLFNNKLSRHMVWIAQGIAIWGALRISAEAVGAFVDQLLRLDAVQARVGFITGQDTRATVGQFQEAGQYGIAPAQAGEGMLTAGRLNLGRNQVNQAQQLALVFGADQYNNILQELFQVQARADAANVSNVNTLDYLATAYKNVDGNLESYFDALQYGIELHRFLGLTAEQAGLAIGEMANAIEADPNTVKTLLGRIKLQINNADVRDELSGLGITGPSVPDYFQQIAAGVAAGGPNADAIINAMTTGLQGASQGAEFRTILDALNTELSKNTVALSEFNTLVDEIGNTGPAKIDRMKAAFANMLLTISDTGVVQTFFDYVLSRIVETTTFLEGLSFAFNNLVPASENILSGQANPFEAFGQALDETNRGRRSGDIQTNQQFWGEFIKNFYQNLLPPESSSRRRGAGRDGPDEGPPMPEGVGTGNGGARRIRNYEDTKLQPPGFGGFQDLPAGVDWDRFLSDIAGFETKLQQEVPGYELDRKQVAFWDASVGYYRTATGDSEAIRRALDEQTDLLKTITGIFNVPAGGEILVPFSALTAGFQPDYLGGRSGGAVGPGDRPGRGGREAPEHLVGETRRVDSRQLPEDDLRGGERRLIGQKEGMDRKRQPDPERQTQVVPALNIQLRNVVMLNGRIIQDEIAKMLRRAMSTTRSGTTGGAGSNQLLT